MRSKEGARRLAGRGGRIKKQERAAWKLHSLAMVGMVTACALCALAEARASESDRERAGEKANGEDREQARARLR